MILDEILEHKRHEVAERQLVCPISSFERQLSETPPPRGFARALQVAGVSVIAEIKRKSPSGGELRAGASAADLGRTYAANGAAALSVLTDHRFFGGSDADLGDAKATSGLPVLRKDFVVDAYQLYEARAIGADAILLIVRSLDVASLTALLATANELQLDALVEAHSKAELDIALDVGARLIGVNNRDLDTLTTDPTLAARLRSFVPSSVTYVAESGIQAPAQVAALAETGIDAVLIGEALVRAKDPGELLRQFVAAGQGALAA